MYQQNTDWFARIRNKTAFRALAVLVLGGIVLGGAFTGYKNDDVLSRDVDLERSRSTGGDMYPAFELSSEPAGAVTDSDGNQRMAFNMKIENHYEKRGAFQFAYVFVDTKGQQIEESVLTPVETAPAGGVISQKVVSPVNLDDGYYALRITAAGSDGNEDAVQETKEHFRIEEGEFVPMTINEWFARPRLARSN